VGATHSTKKALATTATSVLVILAKFCIRHSIAKRR
jgi:hypothetical protein